MNSEKKVCSEGIWDSTVPGIAFDSQGVSNYCQMQKTLMQMYPRGKQGKKIWSGIIRNVKRKGKRKKYDCIVGVSGGVDSSYLLYLLSIQGLRVLAVNLDNGWSSDIAVKNIKQMTSALGIDLETYVIDYEEIKDLLRAYMRAGLPWIDIPTDIAIKATMYNSALKLGVKYVFRGNDFRSEGKQPREWTYGDSRQLKYIHNRFGNSRKLKSFPNLPFWKIFYAGFIRGVKEIRPYYYLEYSKQDARRFLAEKFGWQDYGGHHHENIFTKFAIGHWLPEKFGIDKRKITLSAQVISGKITRAEALKMIDQRIYTKSQLDKDIAYIKKKLDISDKEYADIWRSKNKDYLDYPSNFQIIQKFSKFLGPIIKLVYSTPPMAFTEIKMRAEKRH